MKAYCTNFLKYGVLNDGHTLIHNNYKSDTRQIISLFCINSTFSALITHDFIFRIIVHRRFFFLSINTFIFYYTEKAMYFLKDHHYKEL